MLTLKPSLKITAEDIDRAYKTLFLSKHPDKEGDNESAKKINRAREILNNLVVVVLLVAICKALLHILLAV